MRVVPDSGFSRAGSCGALRASIVWTEVTEVHATDAGTLLPWLVRDFVHATPAGETIGKPHSVNKIACVDAFAPFG